MPALLVFVMVMVICADVLLRNVAHHPWMRGLDWSNDLTEGDALPHHHAARRRGCCAAGSTSASTSCCAPFPGALAWYCEWFADAVGLFCCLVMVWYGAKMTHRQLHLRLDDRARRMVTPEWWLLAPLPVAFALLAIEMLFRMRRLMQGERGPREDAVSAA